ncbi:MAG: fibronectin type III domain-containing protein, partial [Candidatus Pacebacteria bacterium]|nr:fibronectin type III domain-containing protein [Candidatus Paceibacterota bacterium]
MHRRGFTLIEIIVIIAVIGILAGFIIAGLSGSRSAANDAIRENDISNLYKSIVGKQALGGASYPDLVSTIEPGKTNTTLQSFIDQFLKTTPYDPSPTKAYLYKGNGTDFSVAAVLDDGSCFIKSTGTNLFGSDTVCNTYSSGGIGLVQNFSLLHGSTYLDLVWSIPSALSSLASSDVSSAIICLESATIIDENSLPSDNYLFEHGTIVSIVNNAYNQYRLTLSNPDYYYYCKTYSYDNRTSTPGVVGSHPSTIYSSSYSSSTPSSYTPEVSSNPPSLGGGTSTGGSTSPSFTTTPVRNPDGTGSITLTWNPGALSTHTLIRRMDNTPPATLAPQSLSDGVQVYNERNDKDGQDPTDTHTYTDTGLGENIIYCYSAWAYDERTNMYSNGFVLACGGIPPSDPSNQSLIATTSSFTLSWTKGSASNTVIRRSINTAPTTIEEGTAVYNSTGSSFTDNDPTLTKNTTYCYSIWSYNPSTAALSMSYISGCGSLANISMPTNLTFPTIAYNSLVLNWTPGTGSTKTYIVRKQGSIPTSRTDGTNIYNDNGNAFIDTGLTTDTQYCYAVYATDGTEYTEPLTACQATMQIINGQCGTASKAYYATNTGYGTDTFCSSGSLSVTPAFPAVGATVSWSCNGSGGSNASCSASRNSACISMTGINCSETTAGSYTINTYTLTGTTTTSTGWTIPAGVSQIEYLVVGAGGGAAGGTNNSGGAGGGGAGGFLEGTLSVTPGDNMTVIIGGRGVSGGAGNPSGATKGGNSQLGAITATGGGDGSRYTGGSGGSGGGGSPKGTGISGQGYDGGTYNGATGGGGGGAGAVGLDGTSTAG